jgi:tetratricopeptide (TPR) repeat protein
MKRLLLVALCLVTALPVQAVDNFTKGRDFYNHGQYDKALAYLQDTVSKNPRKWEGHYYLAHTYLSLGRTPEAIEQYQLTQACKPTPEVAAACQGVIARVAATAVKHGGMPDYSRDYRARQEYIGYKKQEILNQASAEALRIRQEGDAKLMSSTNTAGGKASLGNPYAPMSERRRARDIQEETALGTQKLYDDARTKMRNMR